MRRVRGHLTYANVVLTILAFIVLGGNAWALARHSVGTKQLKKGAVTTKAIRNGAVTAAKIANGAVKGSDIKPASFDLTVHRQDVFIPNGFGGTTATCPAGKKAVAGGGQIGDVGIGNNNLEDSRPVTGTSAGPNPDGTFTGWRAFWNVEVSGGMGLNATVYVVCLG